MRGANRRCRITLRISDTAPPIHFGHFIHHGPLQLLVMGHSLPLVSTYIESAMKNAENVDVLTVFDQIRNPIVAE